MGWVVLHEPHQASQWVWLENSLDRRFLGMSQRDPKQRHHIQLYNNNHVVSNRTYNYNGICHVRKPYLGGVLLDYDNAVLVGCV